MSGNTERTTLLFLWKLIFNVLVKVSLSNIFSPVKEGTVFAT